ncbi:MAG: DNRLRE domain-containing protein [Clostridia bacterium]|nr:DNRLRE domain-containing protein [Clostridia bacterium]
MRSKRSIRGIVALALLVAVLATVMAVATMTASAEDFVWNLLTDTEAGYRVEDRHGSFDRKTEADGTVYMENRDMKSGALYIHDENNILGSYRAFTLEGDFYFDAFPGGPLRDGKYTPEERPLSFLCWVYKNAETGAATTFNALRIDSQGYLYTGAGSADITETRLELKTWYNIRCAFLPSKGICEVFINGEKAFDYNYTRFDEKKFVSGSVRYFDGYFEWSAKMKNLFVKTDSNYSMELPREEAADYLGYQTTKPEGDTFSARMIFGVNGDQYRKVGYEIYRLTTNNRGEVVARQLSATTQEIYTSVRGGGKDYNVKDAFSYNYAAALTVEDLPVTPGRGGLELVVRPYVEGFDGIRRYGVATKIAYTGEKDENGYPMFHTVSADTISVIASDDTYIYNGGTAASANYGAAEQLMVRNTKDGKYLYRAAYYKFTLDAKSVEALATANSAKLRVYCKGTENTVGRKPYDMMVYATGTDWTESTLNYSNHTKLAPTIEQLEILPPKTGYYVVDILYYLREQPKNADGSITVSFFFTNVGADDAALSYFGSKESDYKPVIEISGSYYNTTLNLDKMGNDGYEPWGFAESIVNEWFDELVDQVYPKDENGNVIYHEIDDFAPEGYDATAPTGDFTSELIWKSGSIWTTTGKNDASSFSSTRYARTMLTLGKTSGQLFLNSSYASTKSQYDAYGGITNAGFTGTATGFFHTEKIDGRYYIIDPLGNPYFAIGINTVCLGDSANHKTYSLEAFGSEEVYYEEITAALKEMGINTNYGGDAAQLLAVENGLSNVVSFSVVGTYMGSLGRSQISEGVFPFNNTINVFDPDFITSANASAAAKITTNGYADMPNLLGYTTDNELPSGADILDRYLLLDPKEEVTNSFSYAVAWTWLARRMGTPAPTLDDFLNSPEHDQMNSEFLGFLYARVYRVSREAIKAVDPNHMYIGSRVNGNCRTNEDYLRAAGYYLDIITTNLYGGLNPNAETMTNFYRYSGKPFIVTEFFAKGMDAIDANGYRIANSTGSGILVMTQQDRADYYEHYALAMLECRGCVGWTWYRYRDNDQGIYVSKNNPEKELIMLHVSYGANAKANTFMDEDGNILTAAQVGAYDTVYKGEPMMSNQNVNKGIFNSDFSSVVTVYTYDASGKLTYFMSYEVLRPESAYPNDGTVLKSADGTKTFTLGTVKNSNGTTTQTVLTVYEGRYLALSDSIRFVSDHLMGLVRYFDEN